MKSKALLSAAFAIGLSCATLACEVRASSVNLGEGHTPSIASDGHGHVFVVFEGMDNKSGVADIFCATSSDGGKTWTDRLDVSSTLGVSTRPRIAVEKSGALDVVWTDTASGENSPDIFYTRSIDSGRTWSKAINISKTPGASRDPEVAIGPDDSIHVIFSDTPTSDGSRDIFYTLSTDGGKTWRTDRQLENVSNTANDSTEPTIAVVPDGTVHVAWRELNSSTELWPHILYTRRTQNAWSKAANVSDSRRYSYHPVIACGSTGKIYITWAERLTSPEGAADILCADSENNTPITHATLVTNTGSIASIGGMTADKTNRVAVAWPDRALGTASSKILFKVLTNNLKDSNRPNKIRGTSASQLAPALVIDGDSLTIAWEERSPGSNPIRVRSIDLTKM
jgi:BNR repeat-like domain